MDLVWTRARLVLSGGPARTCKGEQTCHSKKVRWWRIIVIEETDTPHTEGDLHVIDWLLRSLLMNEVGQGSWYIVVLCFTDLFFTEIYNSRQKF